mgnify:FL=1
MSGLWPLLLFFGGGLGGNCSDGDGRRDSFGGMSNILPLLLLSCVGFGSGCGCSCGENCRCRR